jgi:hypothetical protein
VQAVIDNGRVHVDDMWTGPLRELRELLERGFLGRYRDAPAELGGGILLACPLAPSGPHLLHAVEHRADDATLACSHGCDEERIRGRLLETAALAFGEGDERMGEGSVVERLRDAGIVEDGRTFYAIKGAAAAGFLIERLWTENGVGWLAGEPKTLKTWLAGEMIVCVTTGRPALGEFPCNGRGECSTSRRRATASGSRSASPAFATPTAFRSRTSRPTST